MRRADLDFSCCREPDELLPLLRQGLGCPRACGDWDAVWEWALEELSGPLRLCLFALDELPEACQAELELLLQLLDCLTAEVPGLELLYEECDTEGGRLYEM